MEPLGAKENVDQTQILGFTVGEPLMTPDNKYVARCHQPRVAFAYTQCVASHNDHDLSEIVRGWINRVLRIVSINGDRKGIGKSPVFYVRDRHRQKCNWSVTY